MANPSVTYTFTNGNVADASQVNQNFTDLINSLIDGSKSINIDAATIGGLLTANGNVDLGNAAGDSISMTGFIDTNVTMKSVDAGASAGPDLIIDRDSASAADSDALGRIIFRGNDDAGTPADNDYASIEASIVDSGAGSEDGKLDIKISEAGTATSYIMVEATKGVALKGRTDGQAVAAGYVGEVIASTDNGPVSLSTSYATVRSIPITITGLYLLKYSTMVSSGGTVSNGGFRTLVTTSSSGTSGSFGNLYGKDVTDNTFVSGTNGYAGTTTGCFTATLTAGTTIYMRVNTTVGTPAGYGYIEATRIA